MTTTAVRRRRASSAREPTPGDRPHAEHRQQIVRRLERLQPNRLACIGRVVDFAAGKRRDRLDALAALLEVEKSGSDAGSRVVLVLRSVSQTTASASMSFTGAGRSSTVSMTLKIAVLAPIPSAIVSSATTANAGLPTSSRSA